MPIQNPGGVLKALFTTETQNDNLDLTAETNFDIITVRMISGSMNSPFCNIPTGAVSQGQLIFISNVGEAGIVTLEVSGIDTFIGSNVVAFGTGAIIFCNSGPSANQWIRVV